MPVRALSEYLDANDARYQATNHPPAVTAQEVAEHSHISGARLAKTVIINSGSELAMAVIPADKRLNLEQLGKLMGKKDIVLTPESQFKARFPDCETGGMPPLGGMYGLPVYMDRSLLKYDWIAFNAGTHTEIIKMDTGVFKRLVNPILGHVTGAAVNA